MTRNSPSTFHVPNASAGAATVTVLARIWRVKTARSAFSIRLERWVTMGIPWATGVCPISRTGRASTKSKRASQVKMTRKDKSIQINKPPHQY